MKRSFAFVALTLSLASSLTFAASPTPQAAPLTAKTASSPAPVAVANNYRVNFKVLRGSGSPAAGFKVDAWVKGRSKGPKTLTTDTAGMAVFTDLPTPDSKHQLTAVLHYYTSKEDEARKIVYPYISSDNVRLNDTQVIPNTATPTPQ